MPIPRKRRVDTIGVRYLRGERRREEYDKILIDHLGVEDEDVLGIGEVNNKRFLVKLETNEYKRVINDFCGRPQMISDDIVVMIDDVCSYQTKVIVRQVPFEIDLDDLMNIFSRYGKVNNICQGSILGGRYQGKPSSDFFVYMDVLSPIPNYLFLKDTLTYISVYYPDRRDSFTCRNCGYPGHVFDDCEVENDEDKINIIDLGHTEDSVVKNVIPLIQNVSTSQENIPGASMQNTDVTSSVEEEDSSPMKEGIDECNPPITGTPSKSSPIKDTIGSVPQQTVNDNQETKSSKNANQESDISKNDISKLTPSPKTCCSQNAGDLKAENGLSNLNSSPKILSLKPLMKPLVI